MIEQENNNLLYLESLTNDEVQMGDLEARMGQPKDPKQQHILLLLPWWSLEVWSPAEGTEYERIN